MSEGGLWPPKYRQVINFMYVPIPYEIPVRHCRCASHILTASLSSSLLQPHRHAAMCQWYIAKPPSQPQPCLKSLLFHHILSLLMQLASLPELTMTNLQKYQSWTSKIRSIPKHQANKQPHGLGALQNRG